MAWSWENAFAGAREGFSSPLGVLGVPLGFISGGSSPEGYEQRRNEEIQRLMREEGLTAVEAYERFNSEQRQRQQSSQNEPVPVSEELASDLKTEEKLARIKAAKEAAAQKVRERQTSGYMGQQGTFLETGTGASQMQADLMGLNGPEAQRAAIAMVESSPQFSSLLQQGENAILANAAATGGVRGGNIMAALAQFRPQLLSSLIEQQHGRLAGAAGLGAQVGQGLIGAGISREQDAAARAERYGMLGTQLGLSQAEIIAQGKLGQLQYDVQMDTIRREEEAARQAQGQAGLAGVGQGALAGAGTGASVGLALGGPPGALLGAGVGALGGGLLGALPMFGSSRNI